MHTSISFDPVADRYDETRGGQGRADTMAGLLGPHLPGRGTLLEVGVGTGIVGATVARRGRPVVGVDLAAEMLARAARRLPGRVARADAHRLPLAEGSVAGAYLVWVLHLVADPGAVVAEVARVVAPGGVVAAVPSGSFHAVDDPVSVAQRPLAALRPDRPGPEDVAAWMASAGLVDVRTDRRIDTASRVPDRVADEIEQRVWSGLWDVPDDRWQEVVVPVIEALRALPDADQPHPVDHEVPLVVGHRP